MRSRPAISPPTIPRPCAKTRSAAAKSWRGFRPAAGACRRILGAPRYSWRLRRRTMSMAPSSRWMAAGSPASPEARPLARSVLIARAKQNLAPRMVVVVDQVLRGVVELAFVLVGEVGALEGDPEVRSDVVLNRRIQIECRIEAIGAGTHLLTRDLGQIPAPVCAGDSGAPRPVFVVKNRAR